MNTEKSTDENVQPKISSGESRGQKFCEKNARNGKLGAILGKELLEKVGFDK